MIPTPRTHGRTWPTAAAGLLLGCLFLPGCSKSPAQAPKDASTQPADEPPVRDLQTLEQDCSAYIDPGRLPLRLLPAETQARMFQQFRSAHFRPWQPGRNAAPRQEVQTLFAKYAKDPGYGENARRHSVQWVQELSQQAGLDNYPNCNRRGIALRNTSLRHMPTLRPRFDHFTRPGEGYPFDMLQESAVWLGEPLFVSHLSRDRRWVMAETSFGGGWMPAEDVAFVDDELAAAWGKRDLVALVKDDVPLDDGSGLCRLTAHVGAVFPLEKADDRTVRVLAPALATNGMAGSVVVSVSADAAAVMPLEMTAGNLARVANRMLGQAYGWGGLHENRDCSATLRDLFIPFGLHLPRNSAEQAQAGTVISLKDAPAEQKERTILDKAVPMLTLVHCPGHIMLYVGQKAGRAIVLHNFWGVRVRLPDGGAGRKVVGQCCITTLQPGVELPNILQPEGDLRNRIDSLILLAPPTTTGQGR